MGRNGKGGSLEQGVSGDDQPIFFFHHGETYGAFSQWYYSDFTVSKDEISTLLGGSLEDSSLDTQPNSFTFCTAEQFMMYCKALVFCDYETAAEILYADTPNMQKALGKRVADFSEEKWDAIKIPIVEFASRAKFGQQPDLKALLLGTGERELAEASPSDRIWGIGYREKVARVMTSRKTWGQNLLGKALMSARDSLRKDEGSSGCERKEPTD